MFGEFNFIVHRVYLTPGLGQNVVGEITIGVLVAASNFSETETELSIRMELISFPWQINTHFIPNIFGCFATSHVRLLSRLLYGNTQPRQRCLQRVRIIIYYILLRQERLEGTRGTCNEIHLY